MNDTFEYAAEAAMHPHIKRVLDGEYATGLHLSGDPLILDLGANIGAFTYWAKKTYPESRVIAYEPHPGNATAWRRNIFANKISRVELIEAAVVTSPGPITLYTSNMNCGMHSIIKSMPGDTLDGSVQVDAVHPDTLPNAHLMKLDIEGPEVEVLTAYLTRKFRPLQISVEFHSVSNRIELENLLTPDYFLATGLICAPNLGTFNYVLKSVYNQEKPKYESVA